MNIDRDATSQNKEIPAVISLHDEPVQQIFNRHCASRWATETTDIGQNRMDME